MISFVVPGVPAAQPRERVAVIAGHLTHYTPQDSPVVAFKATARLAARAAYKGPPLEGPLKVDLLFIMPRTKSQMWKRKPMPRLPHAKKPDRDNLEKSLYDSLGGLLWIDDAQICAGATTKLIASGDEQPHVQVRVEHFRMEG